MLMTDTVLFKIVGAVFLGSFALWMWVLVVSFLNGTK